MSNEMLMTYSVVCVTDNLEEYPEYRDDTEEFPHLVEYIEDEIATFVVDAVGHFWPADEFFNMVNVKEFVAARPSGGDEDDEDDEDDE